MNWFIRLFWVWTCLFALGAEGEGGADGDDGSDIDDGADDSADDDSGDDSADGDADDGDSDTSDDDDNVGHPPVAKKVSRASQEIIKLRERSQKAEREAESLRREAEFLRQQNARPAGPSPEQAARQDEDRRLADPTTTEMERWQINANRVLREQQLRMQQTELRAVDASDRAEFDRAATRNPALHDKYRDRVEEALTKLRAQGQNASRSEILKYLVGEDMVSRGTSKPKAPGKTVPRGKTPGARSDGAPRGSQTESQKRRARLENQTI